MRSLLLRWPILIALVTLPVMSLFVVQGMLSFYAEGIHIGSMVAAACVLLLLLGVAAWYLRATRRPGAPAQDIIDMVEANPSWGTLQQQAWQEACLHIEGLLAEDDKPEALLPHSLSVLRQVASAWHRSGKHIEYSVALPEALLAIETLASRYRSVVIKNVPLSNKIKLSQVLALLDLYGAHGKKIQRSYQAYQAYRAYRIFTPQGLIAELSSLVLGGIGENAKETLLYNLKRAYLQEVANVAIDLYSGNFKRALNELPVQQDIQRDLDRLAKEVGPVRILVVGQVSSGKSTLVNALLEEIKAESGLIPITESESVYQFAIEDGLDTRIVDTPGVESGKASVQKTAQRLMNADLVVWVMRANQPARSIDQELYRTFNKSLEDAPERQRPAIMAVATHIDSIPAFSNVREDNLLEVTAPLADACRKSVAFDVFCPVSLKEPQLGVSGLRAALTNLYERAINTRLNRIRMSQPSLYESSSEELRRLGVGSLAALKLGFSGKEVQGRDEESSQSNSGE
ncbi:GTPase family protein [Kineobactrum sediminis]|nr:GTPase [Kineobactrum sediminis]